jgi:ligand-binding sensor domain-containing protein/signal transduction histidine kinase
MLAIRTWPVFRCAALLALLALSAAAHALRPERPIDHLVIDTWRTGDGLPELAIEALLETSDGYLWVGTQEGLARFDGLHFTVFDHVNTPLLRADYVTMLVEDAEHALWVGSQSGLLTRHADGIFVPITAKDGLQVTRVFCGLRAGDGSIWVGGAGGLAHIASGHVVRSYDQHDGLESSLVTDLAIDHDGSLWIVARNRLHRLRNDRIERFSQADGIAGQDVVRVFTRRSGQLMVLGSAPMIFNWDGKRFDAWWPPGVPTAERIRAIHEDREGTLWFASDTHGLFRIRTRPGAGDITDHAFDKLRFEVLYEDSAGSLWLGTLGRGLLRLHDGSFDSLTESDGLAGDAALSVLAESSGDVWIGTTSGLTRLSGASVRRYSTADGLPNNHAAALADDRLGGLWIGLRGNVVAHLRQGKIDGTMALKPPLVSNSVSAVLVDARGQLWVGTNGGGLAWNSSDGLRYFNHGDNREANYINAIAEDSHGTLWIGTNVGLWSIRGGELDTSPLGDAAVSNCPVTSLHEDERNRLWIGTMSCGLWRVERGMVTRYGREQGLPDDTINSIVAGENGDLWLGSNNGIVTIPHAQVDEIATGRRQRFDVMRFGEADGLRIAETVSGTQPVSWRGADGRLWFVTSLGVAVVDPKHIQRDLRPLQPLIEDVRANETAAAFTAGELRLPAKISRLEIRYTAPDLISGSALQFRYRLSNVDDAWSYVGNERVARYINVPPGPHRFEVQARRELDDWSSLTAAVDFDVAPLFYQTGWFLASMALLGGLILWLLHHLRIRWLRMETAVADERRRIAGEIHDSLAQGFTAISVQIEAALGRLQRAPDLAVSHLRLAREVAGKSLTEARRSVWNLHSAPPSVSSLMTSIQSACEQIVYGYETKLTIAASGKAWIANPFIEQNVVRIAQEAVSNALHHGEAANVEVLLGYRFTQVTLTITDDGRGFDACASPASSDRGFGLAGMRRRADALRAEMKIESSPGVGTCIRVAVPRRNLLRGLPSRFAGRRHHA